MNKKNTEKFNKLKKENHPTYTNEEFIEVLLDSYEELLDIVNKGYYIP